LLTLVKKIFLLKYCVKIIFDTHIHIRTLYEGTLGMYMIVEDHQTYHNPQDKELSLLSLELRQQIPGRRYFRN